MKGCVMYPAHLQPQRVVLRFFRHKHVDPKRMPEWVRFSARTEGQHKDSHNPMLLSNICVGVHPGLVPELLQPHTPYLVRVYVTNWTTRRGETYARTDFVFEDVPDKMWRNPLEFEAESKKLLAHMTELWWQRVQVLTHLSKGSMRTLTYEFKFPVEDAEECQQSAPNEWGVSTDIHALDAACERRQA